MEGKRSIDSRSRYHDKLLRAEGRMYRYISCYKEWIRNFLWRIKRCTTTYFHKEAVYYLNQLPVTWNTPPSSWGPPRPMNHIESPMAVCSSSAKHAASLLCSSVQGHSPSAKSRLKSKVTQPLITNSYSLVTTSAKERLVKPQTPPKPHVEFIQEKWISHLHGE